MDIEAQLTDSEQFSKQLEDAESMDTIHLPDHPDLENAQIVENIEIVVENGKFNWFHFMLEIIYL